MEGAHGWVYVADGAEAHVAGVIITDVGGGLHMGPGSSVVDTGSTIRG